MNRRRYLLITILAIWVPALACGGDPSGKPATTPGDRPATTPRDQPATTPRDRPAPARARTVPTLDQTLAGPLSKTDRVVVLYAPKGDYHGSGVKTFELKDATKIKQWLAALAKIPTKPTDPIKAKLRADAAECRIEFHQGSTELGTLRMKADMLDSPGHTGWAFYGKGEAKDFVALVKGLLSP